MTRISPRAKAGFKILAAFIAPSASPAPMMLWSSSMTRMTLPERLASSTTPFMRLSNWPRNCVPATMAVISSKKSSWSSNLAGTSPSMMRTAKPSAMAVLPTPASPIRAGLFLERLFRICTVRANSSSRPMMRSMRPARASSVKLMANCSKNFLLRSFFLRPVRFSSRVRW